MVGIEKFSFEMKCQKRKTVNAATSKLAFYYHSRRRFMNFLRSSISKLEASINFAYLLKMFNFHTLKMATFSKILCYVKPNRPMIFTLVDSQWKVSFQAFS